MVGYIFAGILFCVTMIWAVMRARHTYKVTNRGRVIQSNTESFDSKIIAGVSIVVVILILLGTKGKLSVLLSDLIYVLAFGVLMATYLVAKGIRGSNVRKNATMIKKAIRRAELATKRRLNESDFNEEFIDDMLIEPSGPINDVELNMVDIDEL